MASGPVSQHYGSTAALELIHAACLRPKTDDDFVAARSSRLNGRPANFGANLLKLSAVPGQVSLQRNSEFINRLLWDRLFYHLCLLMYIAFSILPEI